MPEPGQGGGRPCLYSLLLQQFRQVLASLASGLLRTTGTRRPPTTALCTRTTPAGSRCTEGLAQPHWSPVDGVLVCDRTATWDAQIAAWLWGAAVVEWRRWHRLWIISALGSAMWLLCGPRAVCSPEPQFPHLLSEVVVMLQGGGSEGSLSSARYTVGLLEVTAVIMGKVTACSGSVGWPTWTLVPASLLIVSPSLPAPSRFGR